MNYDEVTIETMRRHVHMINLFRNIVDTDALGNCEREIVAAMRDPKLAFNGTLIAADLLFLLVDEGCPRERLHNILKRIQTDYEENFYEYQLRKIEQGESE
jgi:hypothetical protein